MNSIAFNNLAEFEVLDPAMTAETAGGVYIQIGIGSDQIVNNGCVQDIENSFCFSPNTFCAADTLCLEFI